MKSNRKEDSLRRNIRYLCAAALSLMFLLSGCKGDSPETPPSFKTLEILVPEAPGTKTLGSDLLTLDISHLDRGYMVAIAADNGKGKNVQLVSDLTQIVYSYFLESGEEAVIPFTDGDGGYTVTCYEQIEGSQYCALFIERLDIKLSNIFYPFLYPNQYVNFSADTEACQLAQSLLPADSGDIEGLDAVYDYVVSNVTYDAEKAETVEVGYLPDIDSTLHSGTGICFDYAALMTAMLRARDIPCRLVTGYAGNIKHAWIDVYIQSKGWVQEAISFDGEEWSRMDPTFYSSSDDSDFILSYIGDGQNYHSQYAH